jgi:hypothetical protein
MEKQYTSEDYKKDKNYFLSGLTILGVDAFPFYQSWHNTSEGIVGNMSRLATLTALGYGAARAYLGAQNSVIGRRQLLNEQLIQDDGQ